MLTSVPVQTAYTRYILPAQNGMLASEVNWAADTRIVETAAGIGFGLAVSQGVEDQGCILGGSAFVGITRADPTIARSESIPVDKYPQYDNAGVLVTGDLWVIPSSAVAPTDPVHYNTTTGRLSASGGTAITQARWMTSADADGLAVVRLGNP
jgi:hypothetical protein